MEEYDVVVIGCGGMGSAALYHLARRGVRVLGIDRFDPPHEDGSSHGESRIIRECYWEDPAYVPFVHRAYDLWDELQAGRLDRQPDEQPFFIQTGGLLMGVPGGEIETGARAAAAEHGLRLDALDAAEVASRFAPFRRPEGYEVVYEPRAGILRPETAVAAHLDAAEAAGAQRWTDCVVHGWSKHDGGFTIQTDRGDVAAAKIVVAAGAWLPRLVPDFASRLWVERQVLFWFDAPADMQVDRFPIFACEDEIEKWFYGFPDLGGGIKVAVHHEGIEADPDVPRAEATPEEAEALRVRLSRILPGIGPATRSKTCMYTNTPDANFIVSVSPDDPDVVIVGGGSGHAFKFTSAIGEAAADLATGIARADLEFLSLERPALQQRQ